MKLSAFSVVATQVVLATFPSRGKTVSRSTRALIRKRKSYSWLLLYEHGLFVEHLSRSPAYLKRPQPAVYQQTLAETCGCIVLQYRVLCNHPEMHQISPFKRAILVQGLPANALQSILDSFCMEVFSEACANNPHFCVTAVARYAVGSEHEAKAWRCYSTEELDSTVLDEGCVTNCGGMTTCEGGIQGTSLEHLSKTKEITEELESLKDGMCKISVSFVPKSIEEPVAALARIQGKWCVMLLASFPSVVPSDAASTNVAGGFCLCWRQHLAAEMRREILIGTQKVGLARATSSASCKNGAKLILLGVGIKEEAPPHELSSGQHRSP
ncbi:hypothetical protein ACSSS7_001927 [Eimeria intestinalis]